jgi:hypothetical protein
MPMNLILFIFKVVWVYESLDLGRRIQMAIRMIHKKMTDITQTALQVENK